MDASDLTPAEVLATLYNATGPVGLSFLQATSAAMTVAEAQSEIDAFLERIADYYRAKEMVVPVETEVYFDYLHGRPMKLRLRLDGPLDNLRVDLFDRDAGDDAAQYALDAYRATRDPNAAPIKQAHDAMLAEEADAVKALRATAEGYTKEVDLDGLAVFSLQPTPEMARRMAEAADQLTNE